MVPKFISRCDGRDAYDIRCECNYEYNFDNTSLKESNRLKICYFLHECLTIIDEYNNQFQSMINLKINWMTKDCCFRLLVTMVRFYTVDVHSWHRSAKSKNGKHVVRCLRLRIKVAVNYEMEIKKFSEILYSSLEDNTKNQFVERHATTIMIVIINSRMLKRIRRILGSMAHYFLPKQLDEGQMVGETVDMGYYACIKYLKNDGTIKYVQTTFCFSIYKINLCRQSRNINALIDA